MSPIGGKPPPCLEGSVRCLQGGPGEREFFIDNLLVRIHLIVVIIRWTGLAPWECEVPFPGGLPFTLNQGRV